MALNPKSDLLTGLYDAALKSTQKRVEQISLDNLKSLTKNQNPLDATSFFRGSEFSVIAEIKRASPSRGHMADITDPVALARIYEGSGASAISVLTEETGFKGSIRDLQEVSSSVSIPALRKDFISVEEQILEAKAYGASMVLLIMLGLDDNQYRQLFDFAKELGLEVLVETHSEEEIERALARDVNFLGINTRNLNTFETDITLFETLANQLPDGVIRVAESSVKNINDAQQYRLAGADAVLVGEALVTGDAKSLIEGFRQLSK